MLLTPLPTCFFPSTAVFIDDSKNFLFNLSLSLKKDLIFHLCYSAEEGLELLHAHTSHHKSILTSHTDTAQKLNVLSNDHQLYFDLSAIHCEIYNPTRFNEISVMIVDYAMPGMDGLAFCREIQHLPVKKILLTGQANEQVIMEAFNSGIIDRYIAKNDPQLINVLQKHIAELQYQYFQEISGWITRIAALQQIPTLYDPLFCAYFHELITTYQFVEYYLLDKSGSYLLLDGAGQASYLIVQTESQLKIYVEEAKKQNLPESLIKEMEKGKKIPYFWNLQFQDETRDWAHWSSCLYDAQKLKCRELLYYVLIQDRFQSNIDLHRILSYEKYLKQFREKASQQRLKAITLNTD